jgi:hypothetical protein
MQCPCAFHFFGCGSNLLDSVLLVLADQQDAYLYCLHHIVRNSFIAQGVAVYLTYTLL